MDIKDLELAACDMRADIIECIAKAGSGHPGGSLSCTDILCALYLGGILDHDPHDPHRPHRDRFILSKGHAAPALYTVLAHAGYFPREELLTLRQWGSKLQGHPDMHLVPGVEVSTGSLGQGLSIACGVALGCRLDGSASSVFALLGDGECQEGQVWEAAMYAAQMKLDHLIAIVDRNGLQIDGGTEDICGLDSLEEKFSAFGWDVSAVDGHDMDALISTFKRMKDVHEGRPKALIANTVKGKGVSFMEGQAGWHGKATDEEQTREALDEIRCARKERSRA